MTHKISDNWKQLSPGLRAIVIGLCCVGAVGGLGCVTWAVSESIDSRDRSVRAAFLNKPVLSDSIFALARPDEALAKKIKNTDAIAFLGKKHTYLLAEGGKELKNIADGKLDGNKLTLEAAPRQLFIKGKMIWGSVSLRYMPGKETAAGRSPALL